MFFFFFFFSGFNVFQRSFKFFPVALFALVCKFINFWFCWLMKFLEEILFYMIHHRVFVMVS